MKTEPLNAPRVGMMIFSKEANLMAEVTSVKGADDFGFHVTNGLWSGRVKPGKMLIHAPHRTETREFETDFVRVNEVSLEEADAYYMHYASHDNFAVTGKRDARPLKGEIDEKLKNAEDITSKLGALKTSTEGDIADIEEDIDELIVAARRLHDIEDPEVEEEPSF
jgi:hypothetical protein